MKTIVADKTAPEPAPETTAEPADAPSEEN